jgi:CDGSH-type Zn-finger protein
MIRGQDFKKHMFIVKNILETQIFYFYNLCRCLHFFHNVYIDGEHKAHMLQVNNKNHNFFN